MSFLFSIFLVIKTCFQNNFNKFFYLLFLKQISIQNYQNRFRFKSLLINNFLNLFYKTDFEVINREEGKEKTLNS